MKRSMASVGALTLLTMSLAACGGGDKATFSGAAVTKAGESLKTIEDHWKAQLNSGDVKVRIPDEARCYFQVTNGDKAKEIGDAVLCGPYRTMGAEKTQWGTAGVAPVSGDGDKVELGLDPTDETPFSEGSAKPNLLPWRPDGEEAHLDATVDEPDAPKVEAGTVIEGSDVGTLEGAQESQPVITPDGRYTVSFKATPRVGSATDRKAAPDGGTFLAYRVNTVPASSGWQMSTEEKDKNGLSTSAVVTVGGKDYPIKLGRNSMGPATGAIAVPGDGKDATFGFTYDGKTQHVGADGKRTGDAAAANYLTRTHGKSDTLKATVGNDTGSGVRAVGALSDITVTVTAYDHDKKWAPDGQAWAVVETRLFESETPTYHTSASSLGASYDTKVRVTSATLDGKAAVNTTKKEASYGGTLYRFVFAVPVDDSKTSVALKVIATSSGPRTFSVTDGAPAKINVKYQFAGTVDLTE